MKTFDLIKDLYFGQHAEPVLKNLEWVDGDILDPSGLEELMDEKTIVFHCAAMVSFHPFDKSKIFSTNVEGTSNVVNACLGKKVKKLVYLSSSAAIGNAPYGVLTTEDHLWDEKDKPSNYAISKFYAELEVWRGIEEGLNGVMVNPPLIIGPCDWNKGTGVFFKNALKGMPFYTEGVNGFIYVKDVCKVMRLLGESEVHSERFITVSENLSYLDFMKSISDSLNKRTPGIRIGRIVTGIAWRLLHFIGLITNYKSPYTRESSASSLKKVEYSSSKLRKFIEFDPLPVSKAIEETCKVLIKYPKI